MSVISCILLLDLLFSCTPVCIIHVTWGPHSHVFVNGAVTMHGSEQGLVRLTQSTKGQARSSWLLQSSKLCRCSRPWYKMMSYLYITLTHTYTHLYILQYFTCKYLPYYLETLTRKMLIHIYFRHNFLSSKLSSLCGNRYRYVSIHTYSYKTHSYRELVVLWYRWHRQREGGVVGKYRNYIVLWTLKFYIELSVYRL